MPAFLGNLVLFFVIIGLLSGLGKIAWEVYRAQRKATHRLPPHPWDRHVTSVLHLDEGHIAKVEVYTPARTRFLPDWWYRRWRMIVSGALILMIFLAFLIRDGITFDSHIIGQRFNINIFGVSMHASDLTAHKDPVTTSSKLMRLSAVDRTQYYSDQQLRDWAPSSCSGMSLAMVMRAWGKQVIAAEILQKELDLGVWNSYVGLLRNEGIAMAASHFGFTTQVITDGNLQRLIQIANDGSPVIVNVQHYNYFPNGHFFIVRGGDSQHVFIADSAGTNFTRLTHSAFAEMWGNRSRWSAVLTPR